MKNKEDNKLKELQEEIESLTNSLKRALADYQNLEKRVEADKIEFTKFANAKLLLKILLAVDSLEKAEIHLKDRGLFLAVKQLKDAFASEGLERIETRELDFNPELMECVDVVKGKEGKVLDEIRPGYKLNGKVLRVAQVQVGKSAIDQNAAEKTKPESEKGDCI